MVGAGREGQKRREAMIGLQRVRKVMDAVRCYQQPRGGAKPGRTTTMLATRVTCAVRGVTQRRGIHLYDECGSSVQKHV